MKFWGFCSWSATARECDDAWLHGVSCGLPPALWERMHSCFQEPSPSKKHLGFLHERKPPNLTILVIAAKLTLCFRWLVVILLTSLSRNGLQAQHNELQNAGFLCLKPCMRMLSAELPFHKAKWKCIRQPDTSGHSPTL